MDGRKMDPVWEGGVERLMQATSKEAGRKGKGREGKGMEGKRMERKGEK